MDYFNKYNKYKLKYIKLLGAYSDTRSDEEEDESSWDDDDFNMRNIPNQSLQNQLERHQWEPSNDPEYIKELVDRIPSDITNKIRKQGLEMRKAEFAKRGRDKGKRELIRRQREPYLRHLAREREKEEMLESRRGRKNRNLRKSDRIEENLQKSKDRYPFDDEEYDDEYDDTENYV